MLGFHRSRTQAVVEAPRPTKQRPAPRQQEDDLSQLLAFLPICAPCLLPPEFAYRLPGATSTITAAHDPYLLTYFGTKSGLQLAIHDAARLVTLSGLRENLQQEVDLGEVELSVLLEEGQVTGLTHGHLVKVQVLCREAPNLLSQPRWKTCADGWKFYSGAHGMSSIFVQFVV